LLSGQFLEMTLFTARKVNTISVPQTAVVDFNGDRAVWVVAGDTAERRTVETGMVSGDRIEIASGLTSGERVITSGHSRIVPDARVIEVDETGEAVPVLGGTQTSRVAVAIVSPDPSRGLRLGGAELMLEVRDPTTQTPLAVEDVEVDVTMPMPNMAPMTTMVDVAPGDRPGQFQVNTHFGMAGEWQIAVKVNDPDRAAQTSISVPVQ
ncbi:MAG: FixH family protein, partial [Cyanobacteria bacterium J06648_11]